MAQEAITGVRGVRQQKNISPKEELDLKIDGEFPVNMLPLVFKLANIASVENVSSVGSEAGASFMVRTVEMFIPLGSLVNVEEEARKIEAELEYQRKFLESVRKKLGNESFVAHAPENVVALERKKESDSLSKIESLEKSLNALRNS